MLTLLGVYPQKVCQTSQECINKKESDLVAEATTESEGATGSTDRLAPSSADENVKCTRLTPSLSPHSIASRQALDDNASLGTSARELSNWHGMRRVPTSS